MKPFYLSTAIPYVNAEPHIGHALEFIQADAIARYQRLLGKDVFFLSGTDENSLKNVQAAEKIGEPVQQFVERHATEFLQFKDILNISFTDFIRTTESRHFAGAKKLWESCKPADIYKKKYKGLYCVGCEAFYTPDELIDGKCPEHKKAPEEIEEENYFFRLSNYQEQLLDLIQKDAVQIIPTFRKNEVIAFIERGLEDFSISRSKKRARGWGVPVPGDDEQIMYVWFDALSNYINALDYGTDGELYQKYWVQQAPREVLHVIGKGITRFHAMYWIGMLLSAEVPLPTQIFVHGYMTVEGEKMSKSIGNVVAPTDIVEKYGTDPTRYFLLGAIPSVEDGDFSIARFEDYYTAHLVNGLGNLTSRILTMIEKYNEGKIPTVATDVFGLDQFWQEYHRAFQEYRFDEVVQQINTLVSKCDSLISLEKPWEKAKAGEDVLPLLYRLAECLRHVSLAVLPIIPATGEKMLTQLGVENEGLQLSHDLTRWGGLEAEKLLKKTSILFPRFTKQTT